MKHPIFKLLLVIVFTSSQSVYAAHQRSRKKKKEVIVYYAGSKQIQYRGFQVDEIQEGLWTYFTPRGEVTQTCNYVAGKRHGKRQFFIKGVLVADEYFVEDKPHSRSSYYTNNGDLKKEYFFTNGTLDSLRYYERGTAYPSQREIYRDNKAIAIYKYAGYNILKAQEYYENGRKTGTWLTYSGKIFDTVPIQSITYLNDRKNGRAYSRTQNSDGTLQEEGYFINDSIHGVYIVKLNGEVVQEASFNMGQLHGIAKTYTKGKLEHQREYDNGRLVGVSLIYDYNTGNVISLKYYSGRQDAFKKALPDSLFEYYPSGVLKSKEIYTYTAESKERTHVFAKWNADGKLLASGQYVDSQIDGMWVENYDDGSRKSILNYKEGIVHGKCDYWHRNGKSKLSFTAVYGEVKGWPEIWTMEGNKIATTHPEYADLVFLFNTTNATFTKMQHTLLPVQEDQEVHIAVEEPYESPIEKPRKKSITNQPIFSAPTLLPKDFIVGGDSMLQKYIHTQLRYPAIDAVLRNEATIEMVILISSSGETIGVNIVSNSNPQAIGLSNEAIRVAYSIPWVYPAFPGNTSDETIEMEVIFKLPPQ